MTTDSDITVSQIFWYHYAWFPSSRVNISMESVQKRRNSKAYSAEYIPSIMHTVYTFLCFLAIKGTLRETAPSHAGPSNDTSKTIESFV